MQQMQPHLYQQCHPTLPGTNGPARGLHYQIAYQILYHMQADSAT